MPARTKWDILTERLSTMEDKAAKLRRELEALQRTTFGLPCSGCLEILETEADFARHYLVRDERYLNLGWCPNQAGR